MADDKRGTRIIDRVMPSKEEGRLWVPYRLLIQLAWMAADLVIMAFAVAATALLLGRIPGGPAWWLIVAMMAVRLVAFVRIGMYRAVLRYSGIHTLFSTTLGIALGSTVAIAAAAFLHLDQQAGLGRAFWALEGLLSLVACGGLRLLARMVLERMGRGGGQRVLIYGAGSLGELVLRNLIRLPGYRAVGFLDDNPRRHRNHIHGKTIHGGMGDFDTIATATRAELLIIAISDLRPEQARAIFKRCLDRGVRVLIAKGVTNPLDGGGTGLGMRELAFEDLLQRPSRDLDPLPVKRMLIGKRVLVTGAGGSIGSELCRQIAGLGVASLDLLDNCEYNLYAIHQELVESFPEITFCPHLVNLTDDDAVKRACQQALPEVVFHAAAYKHVPLIEQNPFSGVRNNVRGFRNLLRAADDAGCERLVLISTDKAVRPTNVMGATKRVCELIMRTWHSDHMQLCAVRFGNVLGSSGSVIPRFMAQIDKGGPVTVTHPEITRYFMLIPEAVALVLQAGARCREEPEIFILDMGEPVKIADLARHLIFMNGHRPDEDIKIVYSGLRPGEKLYEELLVSESDHRTDVPGILIAKACVADPATVDERIARLLAACENNDIEGLVLSLKSLVGEWTMDKPFARVLADAAH